MKQSAKLKHWQVFSLIFIGYLISYRLRVSHFSIGSLTSLELAAATTIITLVLLFSWVLLIGIFLNSIPDSPFHFDNWRLIVAVFFCIVQYSLLNLQVLGLEVELPSFWAGALLTLSFWGLFYSYQRVAKALQSIRLGREAEFSEYIVDAISLFAFPIGVWFIQPRINRILAATEMREKEDII